MRSVAFRFHLKDLLLLMLVVGAIFACVAGEVPSIAVAAIYCFASIIGHILIGVFLIKQAWLGVFQKSVVTGRPIIYLLIATVLLIWGFSVIAIANVVVANYSGRTIWLLYGAGPSAVVAAWFIFRR